MPSPGGAVVRWVVHYDELPCGMDGMGGEVELPAMDAVPGRKGRVEGERSHAVEGEHSERQERRPAIRGKIYVCRRQSGKKMVLGGSDRPFRRVGSVLEGRNVLKRDVFGDEEGSEDGGSLII
jgi:hypothetical protein